MASVENTNRFSALETDEDGNFVTKKAPKKQAPKEEEVKPQQQTEQKDRNRVSDRNRRGRGGVANTNNGEFRGRGGRGGAHRGGYIQDGEKREFDRRGAPNNDRPRGRARKGGVGLGRYDSMENPRRNRPARDETDPTVEPTTEAPATDATAAPADGTETAAAVETPAVEEVAVEPVIEEEPDTSLTLEEFQAQQRAKVVDSDVNRQLRTVEINDKQWSKISKALEGKKKFKLNARGEEVEVEEEERSAVVEKKQAKKQVLSLDEFVGSTPAPVATTTQTRSDDSYVPRGGRGGASGEFRGRGGRGRGSGESRGRGGSRGGRGGRGGFRGPSVAIDDKNAFPDLSAAKKN